MARSAAAWLLLGVALVISGHVVADEGSGFQLKEVTLSLLEASGAASSTQQLSGPITDLELVLDHTRTLKASFQVALTVASNEEFRPQQAFLRLTNRGSGAGAYFAAVRAKDGALYATAKSADIQKQVGLQGGVYDAALLIGDTRSAQPLEWAVGTVQVLYAPLDDGSQPVAAPYRAMDRLFKSKPDITHMHRKPERRAPAIVSLAFSAVVVAPVVLYVGVALRAGANVKGFPTSGGALLAASGFHLGLLSILALYLLFWLRLNLMQTVPILAVLAVVTSAFGSSTLGHLAGVRQKQE